MSVLNDQQSRGAIFKINGLMIMAVGQGLLAWWFVPSSKEWWMYGIGNALLGLAAVSSLIAAFILIWKVFRRDSVFGGFRAKGSEQKSSRMASNDALQKAGMLDD